MIARHATDLTEIHTLENIALSNPSRLRKVLYAVGMCLIASTHLIHDYFFNASQFLAGHSLDSKTTIIFFYSKT